jgi:hypothetical protein
MGQCSTLIYLINNQHSVSERIVDIGQFCTEIDADLQKVFGGIEFEVNPQVVQKTISRIKGNH